MLKAFETCVIQMANISIDGLKKKLWGGEMGCLVFFGFFFIHLFKVPEAFKALVHFYTKSWTSKKQKLAKF